jgi:hypothetical protein
VNMPNVPWRFRDFRPGNLPGEEWVVLPGTNIGVSNLGRIRTVHNGAVTEGTDIVSGYLMYRSHGVHIKAAHRKPCRAPSLQRWRRRRISTSRVQDSY